MKPLLRHVATLALTMLIYPSSAYSSTTREDVDVMSTFQSLLSQEKRTVQHLIQPPSQLSKLPQQGILYAKPIGSEDIEASMRLLRNAPMRINSAADLAGEKVMTVRSLLSTSFGDDGNACQITHIAGTDSILITGFWNNAVSLKAKVDVAESTITIPNQVVGQMVDNGDIDIAYCNPNGTPNRSKAITGTIQADGTIYINDWWGIYVVRGANKDRYTYVGYDTYMRAANGKMSFNFRNGTNVEFGVYITQPYDNRVLITNFGNYGMTVYVDLNTERGGSIPSQIARQYPANGANFLTCAIGAYDASGNPTNISSTITLTPAAENNNNTMSWGQWTAISSGTQNMFFGAILDGKITYNGTFSYPKAVTGSLDGEGTESSPYLIRTLDDLKRMAIGVNSVPTSEYNAFLNGVACASVYEGKYFRLMNDIDMGATLFTPIGADAYHYFAGTFDGQGHTIKNINVNSTSGLAALFGLVSPKGVVKNINLENPTVESSGQTAGTVCGWNFGTIDNCHVIGANVTNYARIAGGVVGVGHVVTNCSIKDSYILGANGNPAGIAGQVDSIISDCHVLNTTVVGATGVAGLPAGGVVAALTNGTGTNLSFSGIVDTRTYMCTMSTGGVVGVLSNATLTQSFATGEITAAGTDNYGRKAAAGGVVGKTYGSLIENCYFTGKVSTYVNRCAGGITGWLTPDVQGNDSIFTTINNCYTASMVSSETYLYDKEAEARETIGWIESGTPSLNNLYYDSQLTNLNSTRFGTTTAALTSASGPSGFSSSIWEFTQGQYPRLKVSANNPAALQSCSAIIMPARSSLKKISGDSELNAMDGLSYMLLNNGEEGTQGHCCHIDGKSLKISEDFGNDTLRVRIGDIYYDLDIRIAPMQFEGEGTEANPFLLKTKEDIISLGHITTDIEQTFPGDYFLMVNDIDMENDTTFKGICSKDGTAGTYNKFAGIFDGGGHRILNLNMELMVWTTPPNPETGEQGTPNSSKCDGVNGIFGRLAPDGIIRNLVVDASCSFTFWSRSGVIVGQNEGLVEHCRNHALIRTASAAAGGIVGENRKGTVRRCYNDGTVITGSNSAGGIVATGNGIVEECVNVGEVKGMLWTKFVTNATGNYRVGGIQGENQGTDFYNCLNLGHVSGYKEVGGIAGQLAQITATTVLGHNELHGILSVGTLTSTDLATLGTMGGTNGTRATVEHAYWDGQILNAMAHGGIGLTGSKSLTTTALTSGNPIEGLNTDIWNFAKGKYPVPAWCADEPMLQHARALIITIPEAYTANDFHGTATLSGLSGAKWSISENSPYTLSGNSLSAPNTISAPISDVLTGVSGGFTRNINLSSFMPVPLQGDGTKESPYLISSADDWNELADYITGTKSDFENRYLKVTTDIDFSGKTFKPLFIGTNFLSGTLDGDGHTVKNIQYNAINSYEAAIGTIDVNGTVCNLTLHGDIATAVANTGGFSAKVYGLIQNCENQVNVTATKGAGHSGFGYAYYSAHYNNVSNRATITGANGQLAGITHNVQEGALFENAVNYGTIKSTATATTTNYGGIAATCNPSTFVNCHNEGRFEFATPTATNYVGGIIGNATSGSATKQNMVMTGCYNNTDITANNMLGGLIGNTAATYFAFELTDCHNKGTITSVATKATSSAPTAGITAFFTPGSIIRGCVNYGNVTSAMNVYSAGIAGMYKGTGTEAKPIHVVDCHNEGDIAANGNQGGGIIGIATTYLTVDSCSNTGNISGGFGLGGIVGQFNSANCRIAHCYNYGDVTTSTSRSGGITGWGNVQSTIEECFNLGNIGSTSSVKGTTTTSGYQIGGISGYTGCIVRKCYNLGSVAGASQVGGIAGGVFKNRTQLYDCYNAGEILADVDTCGSLIGMNIRNGANWNTDNVLQNCYYIKPQNDIVNDIVGVAVNLADLAALDMGEDWINGDDYTLPILKSLNNELARLYAACVLLKTGDDFTRVTGNFHIGCPKGISWTVNVPNLVIEGNRVRFTTDAYRGSIELKAAMGKYLRTFNMKADWPGGTRLEQSDITIISEEWYTTTGIRISKPTSASSGVYVVVRTFSNGTQKSEKVTY